VRRELGEDGTSTPEEKQMRGKKGCTGIKQGTGLGDGTETKSIFGGDLGVASSSLERGGKESTKVVAVAIEVGLSELY